MGGYEYYILASYGVTFIVFVINLVLSFFEYRRIKKMIRSQ